MRLKIITIAASILFAFQGLCHSESKLVSAKVGHAPVIDGNGQDLAWAKAKELIAHDPIADLDMVIKSVYTHDKLFFLVRFNDPDESRVHKPWIWNQDQEIYEIGTEREDCFVFKWAMDKEVTDLSLHADRPYTADIWFWKANRTDPMGYADDKIQRLSPTNMPKSMELRATTGVSMFLRRQGDKGKPAYQSKLFVDYSGDKIPQFEPQNPSDSRADVKARGIWSDNAWSIEFSRSLKTGHDDDVQFDLSQAYLLGVSRHEIAGKKPNPQLSQPLYGAGDISDRIFFVFDD